jgi:enoyl-CoA hydratase/carnithine racemase
MTAVRRQAVRSEMLAIADGVAWLTLPRERIDQDTAQFVCDAAERIGFDESVGVAVVQGSGRRFCFGVQGAGDWQTRHDWVAAIAAITVPVVAAIAGDAIAEGAELALACDLQVASSRARFAFPQIAQGRLPRHGASQRLPRAVGRTRAFDLLLTGRHVGAAEAARIGLVSHVVPAARLQPAVRELVNTLRAKGPVALRLAKEAVLKGSDLTLDQGIRLEQDLYVLLQTTSDRAEGVRAFLQKRPPKFRGS